MHLLGRDLARIAPQPELAVSLRMAASRAQEPDRTMIALAVLSLSCSGWPVDWPLYRRGEDWSAYGRRLVSYLTLSTTLDERERVTLAAHIAMTALDSSEIITAQEVDAMADFFGLTPPSSPASDSAPGTRDPPSPA